MTQPRLDESVLQQCFDGELEASEAERVRALLENDDLEQGRLGSLHRLRDFVQLAAEDLREVAPSQAMLTAVRNQLNDERPTTENIAFSGQSTSSPASRSMFSRANAVPAIVGLVMAAAVLVWMLPLQSGPDTKSPVAAVDPAAVVDPPGVGATDTGVATVSLGSEVLDVDLGESTGTVFAVQGDFGEPIAVVWIDDSEVMQ